MEYSTFIQLAERIVENARARFLETGSVPFTLFIVTSKDRMKIVELPDEILPSIHEASRDAVRRYKGTAVVFVGEAWLAEYKAPSEEGTEQSLEEFLAHHPSPGAHPDRVEVLMAEAIHPERANSWLMRISREGGRTACGRAEPFEEGGIVFGKDLLLDAPPSPTDTQAPTEGTHETGGHSA